jgi:hypothetical protein
MGRSKNKTKPMHRTWRVNGAYANWSITVEIQAPDQHGALDVPEWPSERIAPVIGHFREAVNHYEVARDADDARRYR